jgi:hypothetical protein
MGRDRSAEAAEAVVQANQTHIDVLADALRLEEHAARCCEIDVAIAHEQMVVLDTNRPVRSKPVFETSTDRTAPTGFARRGQQCTGGPTEGVILVAGDGGTPLYVKQDVVPSVADLTGDQPKCIDPRTVKVGRKAANVQATVAGAPLSSAAVASAQGERSQLLCATH